MSRAPRLLADDVASAQPTHPQYMNDTGIATTPLESPSTLMAFVQVGRASSGSSAPSHIPLHHYSLLHRYSISFLPPPPPVCYLSVTSYKPLLQRSYLCLPFGYNLAGLDPSLQDVKAMSARLGSIRSSSERAIWVNTCSSPLAPSIITHPDFYGTLL